MDSRKTKTTVLALVTLTICIYIWSANNRHAVFSQQWSLFGNRISGYVPSTVSVTPFLYVRLFAKRGRFGNQLYQYASLLGIARHNNRTPIWARGDIEFEDIFKIQMLLDINNTISKSNHSNFLVGRKEIDPNCYENWTESLPNRNMSINGYLKSRLYYNDIERELRNHFTFKAFIIDQARLIINNASNDMWNCSRAKRNHTTFVAIHVRRSDYLQPRLINYGWKQPTADYYKDSMEYFKTRYRNVTFVLFSDDIPWCRKIIRGTNVIYIEGQTRAIDLAVASLCDHAIVTIGSFGHWIAWFVNGVTVRPRDIPTNGSIEFRHMITCGNNSIYNYPKNAVLL